MKKMLLRMVKDEKANSMVENVIVLPIIIFIIFFIILMGFIIHDRSTLEAAAKRGTIYASHAICDPKYLDVLSKTGNDSGTLDTSIADNIEPYRYLKFNYSDLKGEVEEEIRNIIDKTRIPWRTLEVDAIQVTPVNKIYYQDVSVTIEATYPMPPAFESLGLPTEFSYDVYAKTTVNDPDEFIRNVDMVVDLIADIDAATGGNIAKVTDTISSLGDKITKFLTIEQ